MKSKLLVRGILGAVALVAVLAGGLALSVVTGVAPFVSAQSELMGKELPDFTMKDHKGEEHTLSDYKGKVIALDFASQKCPFSRGIDPALVEIAKKYEGKDVVILGIDSHRETTPEEIAKYAEEAGITWPILKDVDNGYADKLSAKVTPEFFILGKDFKLAYHGAFDNGDSPGKRGDEQYVIDAIDALLAGETPEKQSVQAWGCSIKRK